MQSLEQTGLLSATYSIPLWQGSTSSKFDLAEKNHIRRIDNFTQSNMIPKASQHFMHQQKRHFTISKSKDKPFKFADYYELYKPAPTEPLKYPKINTRTILMSMKKRENDIKEKRKSRDRSMSVRPQHRSVNDMIESTVGNGNGLDRSRGKRNKKHMQSQVRQPYNYDIVNFRDLLDENKRTLRQDEKKSIKQIQLFLKKR